MYSINDIKKACDNIGFDYNLIISELESMNKIDINEKNIICKYIFGSQLYQSANENSDTDYILVTDTKFHSSDDSIQIYTIEEFQRLLDINNIKAIECILAPDRFKLKEEHKFEFILNKPLLRKEISTISSNSWVKCKKKLLIKEDYNLNMAIKSLFHSIRVVDYGIQIAKFGKINTWDRYNYVLYNLYKLSEKYEREDLWSIINNNYKDLQNRLLTEFRLCCEK